MFYGVYMDYTSRNFAIERNRGRLLGIVAELFTMIGLTEDGMVERLSKPLYRKAHRLLRSAESCVRRLIVSAARDIMVEPRPQRSGPAERASESNSNNSKEKGETKLQGKVSRRRGLLFNLFDRPRRKDWGIPGRRKRRRPEPRIHVLDFDPRIPAFLRPQAPAPVPDKADAIDDGTVSAIRLCRRILAMKQALEDIPRHAMRYARWQAKPIAERRPQRASPFRLGWPPGWRIRPTHEVDEILKDCHWLARNAEPALDTS